VDHRFSFMRGFHGRRIPESACRTNTATNSTGTGEQLLFTVAGWPLEHAKEFLIKNGHDLSGPYIIVQFPSWDRDRREFVPTPLVDLTDGRAENDGRRNRVRASWGLSDAGATRDWLLRFSLGFEGDCELAAERPLTLRRLDSPAIRLSL
jgi:hypothetical protein